MRMNDAHKSQMAIVGIAELRIVAAIVAGRNDLIQEGYSDGCGILVSGDMAAADSQSVAVRKPMF